MPALTRRAVMIPQPGVGRRLTSTKGGNRDDVTASFRTGDGLWGFEFLFGRLI
jgi:hypothetical protein